MKKTVFSFLVTVSIFIYTATQVNAIEPICKANTLQEVYKCIDQLNSGSVSQIEITQQISCTNDKPCRLVINSQKGGYVFGTPGSNAGFARSRAGSDSSAVYKDPVVLVDNSSNVTLANLKFTDDPNDPNCPWAWGYDWEHPKCGDHILIQNSSDIRLKQLTMLNAEGHSVRSQDSKNIQLLNSHIENALFRGVWMRKTVDNVLISGNYFFNNSGAGTILDAKNITINNNYYARNQTHPLWKIGGGQLNIGGQDISITGNIFTDASHPTPYSGGIEFHPNNINVTIQGNQFSNMNGPAVYNDPDIDPTTGKPGHYQNVNISGNSMDTNINDSNTSAIYDWGHYNTWKLTNNCFQGDASCPLKPLGTLSVTPDSCIIENGQDTCSILVSWFTSFASNVTVMYGNTLIGSGSKGSVVFPRVTYVPKAITLLNDGKVLATQNVSGQLTNSIVGYLDGATCERIGGWAGDSKDPTSQVQVDFYSDGEGKEHFLTSIISNTTRNQEVCRAIGSSESPCNHGFTFSTPEKLKDGQSHIIDAYAVIGNSNFKLIGSGKNIKCSGNNQSTLSIPTQHNNNLQKLIANFGKSGVNLDGDLDQNGKVDIFDFNLLASHFEK